MVEWRRGQGQSVMKLIWSSGLPEIYARLEKRGGVKSVMKLILYSGLPEIYARLWGGVPNMSTLRNLLLLHRGLLYERPVRRYMHVQQNFHILNISAEST